MSRGKASERDQQAQAKRSATGQAQGTGPHLSFSSPANQLVQGAECLRQSQFGTARQMLGQINTAAIQPEAAQVVQSLVALCDFHLGWSREAIDLLDTHHLKSSQGLAAWNEMAVHWKSTGQLELAIRTYRAILKLAPTFAEAHYNLGLALEDDAAALDHLREAARLAAQHAVPHIALANAELRATNYREAVRSFERAIALKPESMDAWLGRGNGCYELGDLNAASESYQRVLQVSADHSGALTNLGNTERERGNLAAATLLYQRAIAAEPNLTAARINLALISKSQSDLTGAKRLLQEAIALDPELAEAHTNLGNVHRDMGELEAAGDCFERAAKLVNDAPLFPLRQATLCPRVFADRQAIEQYHQGLATCVEGLERQPRETDLQQLVATATEPPFDLQFHHGNIRSLKESYARLFQNDFASLQRPLEPRNHTRPRIGILVTKNHERIFLRSMVGVLRGLDADQFEMIVICSPSGQRVIEADLANTKLRVQAVPDRLLLAVEAIRSLKLDLLSYWEIGTDGMNYFLPFVRLAPVQCTSWGIQVTSGIANVDYYLSSQLVEPADAADHYSERLLNAATFLTYQYPTTVATPTRSREDFGLRAGERVYACPQNLGKIHPDFDATMRAILEQDGNSRIVLTGDEYGIWSEQLKKRWSRTMPATRDRVLILPRMERDDYLSLIHCADVLIDPPHFGGVNTSYDSFSLNKVVITLRSAFHRGRYTAGCYERMQLGEMVMADEEQFVATAVRLANDGEERRVWEEKIAERKERLFQDQLAISEHQRLFAQLTQR